MGIDTKSSLPGHRPPPLRILVVEDDADSALAIRKLLIHAGFDAQSAPGYREAVKLASEWIPDALVADIGLPGKDGIDLMNGLREAYPHLKGIVVSGYVAPEDTARSLDAGFAEHLAKPIRAEDLISAVDRLFEANPS